MRQQYELMDMVVAIGFCTTVAAAGTLYAASNGMITISLAEKISADEELVHMGLDDTRWLQPLLGQAIVNQDLLDRRHALAQSIATTRLESLSGQYTNGQETPFRYLDSIQTSAKWAEPDLAMRIQTVMGHAIVQFTGRGVRGDMFSAQETVSNYNARMITHTDARRDQMDAVFLLNWQANLGRAIVTATQSSLKSSSLAQEGLGEAIMQLTTIQAAYGAAHAAIQEHLGAVTVVATRLEQQTNGAGSNTVGDFFKKGDDYYGFDASATGARSIVMGGRGNALGPPDGNSSY